MITVTIKAKYLKLIAYLLKNTVASDVFRLLNEMKSNMSLTTVDDDDITVTVYPNELTMAYQILSELPEGLVAQVNKEMDQALLPQITAGLAGDNAATWQTVMDFVTSWKTAMATRLNEYMQNGRNFILGIN